MVVGVASKLQLTIVHARPRVDTLGLMLVLYDAGTEIVVLGEPYVQNFTVNKHPRLATYACVFDTMLFATMYCADAAIVGFFALTADVFTPQYSFVVVANSRPAGFVVVMMYAT